MKCAIVLLFACAAFAQEFRGTLLGRVTDASGAVVPGATVTAINVETSGSQGAKSNEQGSYRIPFLLPGNYTVIVEHAGFRKIERRGIRISVASDLTLDFVLEIATTGESITVTAAAPLLNTASADLGQVIEAAFVRSLPVSLTRNALNKALLTPGITTADFTGTVTSNAQTQIVIHGSGGAGGGGRNEIMIDGIPNTLARSGGIAVFVPSQDSVEEMKIHTTLFDASYGHSNAGAINISTRAGTNEWHGSVYDFKRWRALNANSWVNKKSGLDKPPVNYNQFGGVISGPLRLPRVYDGRNRTFFLFSLESNADKAPRTRQARVPTDLERSGDFSRTLNRLGTAFLAVYDPSDYTRSGSTVRRSPFPGARIPASRLDPTGAAVAKVFPAPTEPAAAKIGTLNWKGSGVYQVRERQFSIRVDHNLSQRQRLFGRFSRLLRNDEFSPVFFPGVLSFPAEGESDLGIQDRFFHSVALDDTISFTPSFSGSIRYGFSGRRLPKLGGVASGRDLPDPSVLNLVPVIVANQATKGYPKFAMDKGENWIHIGARDDREIWYSHALLGTFYKTLGKHTLKFGADYRATRWNKVYLGDSQSGSFAFNNVFTKADSTAGTADTSGTALASLLLGVPASGGIGYDSPLALQNHYLGLFVQQDWKVLPRLTLNAGLRYELETPYTERYNRAAYGFDGNVSSPLVVPGMKLRGGVLYARVDGNSRRQGNLDANNIGPRLGFAWSLDNKTVLRGGYGLFFSAQSYNSGHDGSVATFGAVTPYQASADGQVPDLTLQNPFPGGLRLPEGSAPGLAGRYGDSLTFFDQYRVNPYNQHWQFSVQREAPGKVLVEVAYVGMLSVKELESFDLNEMQDIFRPLKQAEKAPVPNPFFGIFSSTSSLGGKATTTQGQLWKLYPQYSTLTVDSANTGRAVFHGLEAKVEKRFGQGLNLLWTNSFSKLMTRNTSSIVNERHYRSVGQMDMRLAMRLAFVYDLPFGPGQRLGASLRGVGARLVEGWSVSGFLTGSSGLPLSLTDSRCGYCRPLRLRNAAKSGAIQERLTSYFDTTAFLRAPDEYWVSPEPTYFDELRAPGVKSLNLAVSKDVKVWERLRFQFRAELANVTNSPMFAKPGTNIANQATFGVINDVLPSSARAVQLGFRLSF